MTVYPGLDHSEILDILASARTLPETEFLVTKPGSGPSVTLRTSTRLKDRVERKGFKVREERRGDRHLWVVERA